MNKDDNQFSLLKFICIIGFLFVLKPSGAQTTNPTPYCYPTATAMSSGTCTGSGGTYGYGYCIQSVKVDKISQSSGCYGSGNTDVYRYWSNTTTLNGGQNYVMDITTPQSAGFAISVGAWIDYNRNNVFDSMELIGSNLVSNNYKPGGVKHQINFTVPCNATAGTTRLRVRAQANNQVKGIHACASPTSFGESWDFQITVSQPTSSNAGFTASDTVFTKSNVNFYNDNRNAYISHAWDANNDGTMEATNSIDFKYKFSSAGTKCVKLISKNCFGTDSFVKCLVVVSPTAKPEAKFKTCTRVVEQYGSVQLFDESSNGPWQWTWYAIDSATYASSGYFPNLADGDVYSDPHGNGNNEFSQNPEFAFDIPGTYAILLTVKNDIGTSTTVMKRAYIKVVKSTNYYLGYGTYGKNNDNRVSSNFGSVYDDGGPNLNYGNNQGISTRSYLAMLPENKTPVTLKFHQLKFADSNDFINIYDGDTINVSKLISKLTYSDNGTTPSFISTSNTLYFIFTSNGNGSDSGFYASYYVDGYGSVSKPIKLEHALALTHLKVYNMHRSRVYDNSYTRWKLDNVFQPLFDGMDTFRYTFSDTSTHSFCLESSNCDTTITICKSLAFEIGIIGKTFKDNNSNCLMDTGDITMDNVRIKLYDSSSNFLGLSTTSDGLYNFNINKGTYTIVIDTSNLPYMVTCKYPGIDSTLVLTNINPVANISFDIGCKPGFDVGVQSVTPVGLVFPGRYHDLRILAGDLTQWYGLKCSSGKSGTVKITVAGPIKYANKITGSLTPAVSGKVFTYTISDFGNVNNKNDFGLIFKTDSNANSGDTILAKVEVTPTSGDVDTVNNSREFRYLVRNSLDPNIKEVYPVDVPPLFNDWLTYTIHFQNTGNAPAFNIRIADTLASQLDLSSFQVLNYSHTMSSSLIGKALTFRFPNILLPDSFSDNKGSQGFVQYRIRPKVNLPEGTKIYNTAYIYFDYNTPVVTNATINTFVKNQSSIKIKHTINSVNIYPNPNSGLFKVEIPENMNGVSFKVDIYDVLGVLVGSYETVNGLLHVNIGNHPSGVYIVKVKGANLILNAFLLKN